MIRVTSYFETQLRVPVARAKEPNPKQTIASQGADDQGPADQSVATQRLADQRRAPRDVRPMDTAEMIQWFSKILDAVRLRYRKLQSFARYRDGVEVARRLYQKFTHFFSLRRRLTQRFDNSAEYDLEN